MIHAETWEKINNIQEEIIAKNLKNTDSNTWCAANDINNYRVKLKAANIDLDVMAILTISMAKDFGDGACKYGMDKLGEAYFDLEDKLRIIIDAFETVQMTDKEFSNMMYDIRERAAQIKF